MKKLLPYILSLRHLRAAFQSHSATDFLAAKVAEYKMKIIVAEIRRDFAFFGHDLSNFNDEELEKNLTESALQMSFIGFSCDEACNALAALHRSAAAYFATENAAID